MKTITLILLLTCLSVRAQIFPPVSPPSAGTNAANREETLRALRAAMAAGANGTNQGIPAFQRQTRPRPPGANPPAAGTNAPSAGANNPTGANTPAAGAANPNFPPVAGLPQTAATSSEETIPAGEINFPSVSLDQVLEIYAKLVHRTILRAQLPPVLITLKTETALTQEEAIQAFDSVLAMNGITLINVGDKFVKAVPVTLAPAQGQPFNSTDATALPESDVYITHIVQLKYAKPSEVVPALTPLAQIPNSILPIDSSGILIIRDYTSNVKRMLELLKQIDVTVPLDYESEVIPIRYAQAQDIASALGSLSGGGGGGTSIGGSHSGGSLGARSTGTMGGVGGMGGGGYGAVGGIGGTGMAGAAGQPGALGGATGAARPSSFGDRLNAIVNKAAGAGGSGFDILGQTKIIADARTNSLLVFADKRDMAMIKKIVSELDVVLAQVLIEAIIMEVSLDNGHTTQVSYNQTSPSTPGHYFSGIGAINNGTFLNANNFLSTGSNLVSSVPSGFSYAASFGNDFQATLTAIANDSRITVLSRPRIQTSHGVPASLEVGDTVPEVTGTYFGGINGQASSQYQQTFVGIQLQVTPLINQDGLVVMDIMQDVEQLGTPTTIDGNPVPTTSKRTAQATVSVRDRDTIILGGMISSSKSTTRAGVPFLKDIPGLGYLFRSDSDDFQRKELIVLIRPTVLPTPESAALAATHERNRLPAIKAAEDEEKRDEKKRIKSAEKIPLPDEGY